VVTRDGDFFVGECLEVAVVTQGRTLDELVFNLREAIGLHLEGEDPGQFGLVAKPRLNVTYEVAAHSS
jgi:predicted RNase H-like HicB family nuclease